MLASLAAVAIAAVSPAASVRVDQVGYADAAPKRALLMASGPETGARYTVRDASGTSVLSGPVAGPPQRWSASYPDVYALELSGLNHPGSYTITVSGPLPARSPAFTLGADPYARLLPNAVRFYQAQRDGPDVVPGVLHRSPSHLHDANASVYARPSDSNVIGTLQRIGGPVDVSGGWFDAGDDLKFVETASYTEAIMLTGIEQDPSQLTALLTPEAVFGLRWLQKMWNDRTGTLLYQVGVGDGNGQLLGDHDVWRLPQADDGLSATGERYLAHRPALAAGAAGAPVSPNLAGRLAADFALCFRVLEATQPAEAGACLRAAENVYGLADTTPGALLTASPHAYYPETEWRDDMELGASELSLALSAGHLPRGLPHTDPLYYLRIGAHWAAAYLRHANAAGYDTLNLYDVSGLADAELLRAITQAGNPAGLQVSPANLLDDCTSLTGARTDCGTLHDQLAQATRAAAADPFGLGFVYNQGDVVPHALGVAVEARLYDTVARSTAFAALAQHQLDFVLGANAWGSSFVVGAGSTFPHCLQHQVANLGGSLTGSGALLLGATVDGPNADASSGLPGTAAGTVAPRPCVVAGFAGFSGRGVGYRDGVADWPNVEPTDDYTALTLLAFAQAG